MKRIALLSMLFASACIGSITGGEPVTDDDDDPPQPPPPEPVTDVRVTVRDATTPRAGIAVVFMNADDSVIAETSTDAAGVATAKMPAGGSVSVIRTYSDSSATDQVYTYVGVKPGDAIELVGGGGGSAASTARVTVGLTNGELVGVFTPCGEGYGQAPTIEVQLKGCADTTDFLVVNYTGDEIEGGPLYIATQAAVAPEIDLSSESFHGTLSTQLSSTNMPAMAVQLQLRLVLGNLTVFDSGLLAAPTATTDVPELPNTDQIVSAHVADRDGGRLVMSARSAFSAAPAAIDVAAGMIPVSRTPVLAGDTLAWTETGTGTPDLALASVQVRAEDRAFVRNLAAPYTGMTMRVPALPAAYAKYNVQASDAPAVWHSLARVDGGYDAVRGSVFNRAFADFAPMGRTATIAYPTTAAKD